MLKFQGTYAELGRLYGQRLRSYHHDFYRQINSETLRRQLHIYQKHYPEFVTMIEAAAEEIGLAPEFLLYEDLAAFVDHWKARVNPRNHGCTIFAVKSGSQVFVGRNYDWLASAREYFEQYDFSLTKAYRYFAFSDESVWGRHTGKNTRKIFAEDAVNEHGLYIGLTFSHIDRWNYGLSPSHIIRYVAEHCQTTRQALNVFAKVPCAIPKNFLIADAFGQIAVVEHAAKTYAVLRPDNSGVIIQTNHCLDPELQRIDHVLSHDPNPTTFVRYAEADFLIREQLPNFQFTDLWPILRRSNYVYNPDTIWSLALELSTQRFNLYRDTAMGQKETKFSF